MMMGAHKARSGNNAAVGSPTKCMVRTCYILVDLIATRTNEACVTERCQNGSDKNVSPLGMRFSKRATARAPLPAPSYCVKSKVVRIEKHELCKTSANRSATFYCNLRVNNLGEEKSTLYRAINQRLGSCRQRQPLKSTRRAAP